MFRLFNGTVVVLGMAAVLALTAPALVRADGLDNLVALDDVPAAALDKAKEAAPDVDWILAFKFEDEKFGTWYRLGGKDGNGHLVKAMVTKKGVLAEVRTEVDMTDVPAAAADALKKKAPGFKADTVEAFGKTTTTVLGYRFEGEDAAGPAAFRVSPDGKKVFRD